ncbi:MAG: metalloregulator ArsR/SmtB family transcription factor, partial [candidate division Zixibacteria bacterium]|nr:metalloregulator ArsR/SmtB family transcription factor [candidate division Zixibacteria bacterium]
MIYQGKEINVIKALGDETRLRILKLLMNRELCVCELEAALNLPQSKISRHLMVLRSNGLVNDRRKGQWIFYSLF